MRTPQAQWLSHLHKAVRRVLVLSRVYPLHLRLHYVERVVAQRAEAPRRHAAQKVLEVRQRTRTVAADDPPVLVEPHEPQPLEGGVSGVSGSQTSSEQKLGTHERILLRCEYELFSTVDRRKN